MFVLTWSDSHLLSVETLKFLFVNKSVKFQDFTKKSEILH